VAYQGGALSAVDASFEQHCEGATPALHGQIHWAADDPTLPQGAIYPPPPGLWSPSSATTPGTGSYVYLESDSGDTIGQGQSYVYTADSSAIVVYTNPGGVGFLVDGLTGWNGDFSTTTTSGALQTGYYGNPGNPALGDLSFVVPARGCNVRSGWFVVDKVEYSGSTLSAIDLRFEQHCDGLTPALRGQIHWVE